MLLSEPSLPLFLEVQAVLSKNISVSLIPSLLREIIIKHHAEDMLTTPNYAYFDGETTSQCCLSWLWETILDLWIHADCCANPKGNENTWCSRVTATNRKPPKALT